LKGWRRCKLVIMTVAVALMVFTVLTLADRYQGRREVEPMSPDAAFPADVIMLGVRYVKAESNNVTWTLQSEKGTYFKSLNLARFEPVTLAIQTSRGRIQISGDRGEYDLKEKRVEVSGRVKVVTDDGYHLNSDELFFDQEGQEVYSDAWVDLEGPRVAVRGKGFVYSLNTRRTKLGGLQTAR